VRHAVIAGEMSIRTARAVGTQSLDHCQHAGIMPRDGSPSVESPPGTRCSWASSVKLGPPVRRDDQPHLPQC
jgi:hypothetical protein